MNKNIHIFILSITILFSACTNTINNSPVQIQKTSISSVPEWMDNPEKMSNGKLTAVGCSARHYKGVSAQKKLALKRAIDEIAMQTNTKVSKVSLNRRTNHSSRTTSSSLQEVNEENISTKIMEYYKTSDGDICVWIIKN